VFGATQDIHLQVLPAVSVAGCDPSQSATLRDTVRQRIVDELGRLRDAEDRIPAK
jgi:hypothetical protein